MGCERCTELTGFLEEALGLLDEAGDALSDIAWDCDGPGLDPSSMDREALEAALEKSLETLASVRKRARDGDSKYDRAEKRIRGAAGL